MRAPSPVLMPMTLALLAALRRRRFPGAAAALAAWALAAALPAAAGPACPPSAQSQMGPAAMKEAQRRPQDRGYLWRLDKDGRVSWLYGTLHLGRAAWTVPGPHLAAALRQADTLALELDPLDAEAMKPLLAPGDPARRAQVLTAERARRLQRQWQAVCAAEEGRLLAALPPVLQVTALSGHAARADGLHPEFAIDAVLAGYARRARLPLVALESARDQRALFVPETAAEEAEQVDDALAELENGRLRRRMGELAQMWASGDLARLASYPQWCECMQTPAERALMHQLLEARNPALARGIAALHDGGLRVFAAVGALHMVGAEGLVALLQRRGFAVTQVLPPP